MIFNGHTQDSIDKIDEETFTDINLMYAEGMLGNKGIFDAIAPLTAGVFNYIRAPGVPAYSADSIFPWVNDYLKNPDFEPSKNDLISNSLLAFMSQAQEIGRAHV